VRIDLEGWTPEIFGSKSPVGQSMKEQLQSKTQPMPQESASTFAFLSRR
jgi:hypothetical protein